MNPALIDELRRAGLLQLESRGQLTPKGERWLRALATAADELTSGVPSSGAGLVSSTFALDR